MSYDAFGQTIIDWYRENKRDLPWRRTRDPYRIWLSEVLLQQTRVAQGLPYYERFLANYPSVFELAGASETEVLKLWQGLGYYSRARNLHRTAGYVAYELGGSFPGTYRELLSLKGVGPYTAAAIASFCFDEPVPVYDGNVYRVLSRYFGLRLPINSGPGKKRLEELGRQVMVGDQIAEYNQGIMEFGAIQCKPQSPNCRDCPLAVGCESLKEGMVGEIPVKLRRSPVKRLFYNYLVFEDPDRRTLIEQRPPGGIWPGLYQFPLWESKEPAEARELEDYLQEHWHARIGPYRLETAGDYRHLLSHREIRARFWRVRTEARLDRDESTTWENLAELPVPVLMERFIETV